MRTGVKILIGIVVVLVVLVAGAAIVALTIDPDTLIAPVQAQVKAVTGRELTVRGGARIALSLHPRVVLRDVTISNASWASARDMLKAERLEIAVALVPLLSRRIELEEIELVKPQIALETDGKGQKSWEPTPAATSPAQPGGGGGLAAAVAIGEIEISNGTVTYRDGPNAAVSHVTIDRMSLHPRTLSSEVAIEFRGAIGDVPVTLAGTLGAIESLLAKRWPYPIDVKGEIAGQKVAFATKVKSEGPRYTLDDLKVAFGANSLTGTFAIDSSGTRPKLLFDLSAPVLVLNALPVPVALPVSTPAAAPKASRVYVFPDTPVSFAPLRWVDAQGKLAIGKLTLADGQQYDNLRMQLALDGGRLDMPSFSAALFGGTLAGSVSIDASQPDVSAVALRLDGKGLSLGGILAAAGHPREVKGGKTELSANLTMRGNSPHAWASSASGNFLLVSGPATLVNSKLAGLATVWDKLNDAINPFRTRDPATELVCAVVRLPLANGIAKVDRSIAGETSKLGVSASGTLDFRNETLDFTFAPKAKKGISIDFAGFSDLVRIEGPWSAPHLGVDAAGSAKVIASIGAAVSTGGLSAVGQALFSWAEGSGPGPCQIALGGAAAKQGASTASSPDKGSVPIASDVGKALGKLFGK